MKLPDNARGAPLTAQEKIMGFYVGKSANGMAVYHTAAGNPVAVGFASKEDAEIWAADANQRAALAHKAENKTTTFVEALASALTVNFLSVTETADLAQTSEQAIRDILRNDTRRAAIFPGAYRTSDHPQRGEWRIPRAEVEAWKPREYPRGNGS